MQNYTKKYEKDILKIKDLLVEKGVNEELSSNNGKLPYDLCPPHFGKRLQEDLNIRRKNEEQQLK